MEQFKQKSLEIRYCLFENQIPLWQAVIRVHFFLFPYQFFSYKGINQRRICTIRSSRLRILHIVTINNYNDSCLSVDCWICQLLITKWVTIGKEYQWLRGVCVLIRQIQLGSDVKVDAHFISQKNLCDQIFG